MKKHNGASWKASINCMLAETRLAAHELSQLSDLKKRIILKAVAEALEKSTQILLAANAKDLKEAHNNGLSSAMMDRLTLTKQRIGDMADGVRAVAQLPNPIGGVDASWKRPNGLRISKVRVPIGVVLIIYESRPNVTVECASLCLKSGNVVILRGGKEAFYSNQALVAIFEKTLRAHHVHPAAVSFVKTTDRSAVDFLLKREGEIHLVIPRGGEALIRKVARTSRIPVIKHYKGVCHVFIDESADLKKAGDIVLNAKLQRPGVCNAMETLLVHEKVAARFLPFIGKLLRDGKCEIRGDEKTLKFLPWANRAKQNDFGREFLDKVLAVKVVTDTLEAVSHIRQYGSGHTEAIVTKNKKSAQIFKDQVDASSVMVNASTRFADGFQFGFGAEIGISTDKIHARGPMGLEGLTSYKYIVEGNGQIRT